MTLSAFNFSGQQAALQFEIINIKNNSGKIVVEIYKDKSDWLKKPFRRIVLPTDKSSKTASFDVPQGNYAISIYQDANENGKLDLNFLGIPKEPIGFGNNYRPMGKPNFDSALIEFNSASKLEPIKLSSVF
jgi:uncharacterized protein (DUF2141 family)